MIMSGKYEDLEKLKDLLDKGIISENEFVTEKEKILGRVNKQTTETAVKTGTKDANSFCALMHLSQFANYLLPPVGLLAPIVMWLTRRNESTAVDVNGKIILNWTISVCIYSIVIVIGFLIFGATSILTIINYDNPLPLIGTIGIFLIPLIIFGVLDLVFVIVGAIKANNGEVWNYPLSIRFFKTK